MTKQSDTGARTGGWLTRLKRAEAGNVLPMMAMAVVPIAGMIGSGLDMSRAYLAKAKLQTACDATALATRRLMGGNPFSTDADANGEPDAKTEGKRFFAFNFPTGFMGTAAVTPNIGVNATQTDMVEVSATTNVRTAVMKIFGKQTIPISVSCNADQDFVNNDIMLVLDVTGSMNCAIGSGQSGCSDSQGAQSNSRVTALRNAARKLYQAMSTADAGIVTRYGFMPYSMTTNVGRDLNANFVRDPAVYHTRTSTSTNTWSTISEDRTTNELNAWRTGAGSGCVEERSSWVNRNMTPATNINIAQAVAREDIDTTDAANNVLKWQPYDTDVTVNEGNTFCPAPAGRLAQYNTETAFQTRLNDALSRRGMWTHHDVGMIWGLRYISSTGMFAADNPTTRNLMRVDQHIIFMTDGKMDFGTGNETGTSSNHYSAVGIPNARMRYTGSGGLVQRARARFLSTCNMARQMGVTVWVIVLDVDFADDSLANCASGANRYFEAESASALDNAFDTIGKEIGKLRLTR